MNVSRETYYTAHDLAIIIIATDYCWNNFDYEDNCIHNVSSNMTTIAIAMIKDGEY